MKKYDFLSAAFFLSLALILGFFYTDKPEVKAAGVDNLPFSSFATSSQTSIGSVSYRLSATTTRMYAVYVNTGGTGVYICLLRDIGCTVGRASIYIAPNGGSYEMNRGINEYQGAITAVTSTGTTTINLGEVK